jgi:hypothetical protein
MPEPLLHSVRYVGAEDLKDLRAAVDGLPGEALDWEGGAACGGKAAAARRSA